VINQTELKKVLSYNQYTGEFTWLKRGRSYFASYRSYCSWNAKHAGIIAGSLHLGSRGKTYVHIHINGVTYKAHRLAYLYMIGEWPDEIDHDDGDGVNNEWVNINSVTRQKNGCNKRLPSNNTSGVVGVGWSNSSNKWQSYIKVKQENIYLGKYNDFFEAVCARKSAENFHGFHVNHGSVRPL